MDTSNPRKLRRDGRQPRLKTTIVISEWPHFGCFEGSDFDFPEPELGRFDFLLDGRLFLPPDGRMPRNRASVYHIAIHDDDLGS